MTIKKDNNLSGDKVKDTVTGLYYHLADRSKKKERPREEQVVEETPIVEEKPLVPRTITLNELKQLDPSFSESMFISKVNNMFVKFFTDIMMDRLPEVNHFVSDEVYAYGEEILKNVKNKGQRQMYDELNVKQTEIKSVELGVGEYIINVYLQSRYMEYIIDLYDGSYISGNNTSRKQVNYSLTLKKKTDSKEQGIVRKCPGCGAPLDINASGKCEYCGTIYNQEDYDWVITSLKKL